MSNYWGRKSNFKIPPLAIGIIIIGIICFILFPNLFSNAYSLANSTNSASTLADSNNLSQSNVNNSNALNSSNYSNQSSSNVNTLINGSGNNELSTGYWILFVNNNTFQQLSINAQDYAFLQNLINNDGKGTASNPIFLVESGQIQKYIVSNEINSVITNLAAIYKRSSTTQTPSTTTTTPDPSSSDNSSSNASSSNNSSSNTSSSNGSSSNASSSNNSSSDTSSSNGSSSNGSSSNGSSSNTSSSNGS